MEGRLGFYSEGPNEFRLMLGFFTFHFRVKLSNVVTFLYLTVEMLICDQNVESHMF